MTTHILTEIYDGVSYCGLVLDDPAEFYFKNVEAAIRNSIHDGERLLCAQCAHEVSALLLVKAIDDSVNSDTIPTR